MLFSIFLISFERLTSIAWRNGLKNLFQKWWNLKFDSSNQTLAPTCRHKLHLRLFWQVHGAIKRRLPNDLSFCNFKVFAGFSKFLQMFWSFRTWLDLFGCIRIQPDAFGCAREHLTVFENFGKFDKKWWSLKVDSSS